jgi:hypothetical protein
MNLKKLVLVAALGATGPAMAQEFTGDVKLACEAILCLSTGQPPNQCTPSLTRFFSISGKTLSDIIQGRIDFLNLCPAASQDSNMRELTDAIANGAGRCDADSLNYSLATHSAEYDGPISNQMPSYCTRWMSNPNTDLKASIPVYVGDPATGGFWTAPENLAAAQARYDAAYAARYSNSSW